MDEPKLEEEREASHERSFPVHEAEVEQLQTALTRLIRSVVTHSETDLSLWDLPVQQVRGLRRIAEAEGQSLSDVAGKMKVSLPTASRVVEKLVMQGLVERQADPRDRRAVQLGVTENARAILAQLEASRQAHLTDCARQLDPAARATILEGLRLLAEASEQARPGPGQSK